MNGIMLNKKVINHYLNNIGYMSVINKDLKNKNIFIGEDQINNKKFYNNSSMLNYSINSNSIDYKEKSSQPSLSNKIKKSILNNSSQNIYDQSKYRQCNSIFNLSG